MDYTDIEKEIAILKQCQEKQLTRQNTLETNQREILELLKPISETYRTATIIGKWIMAGLVFASVVVGLLVGLKNLK